MLYNRLGGPEAVRCKPVWRPAAAPVFDAGRPARPRAQPGPLIGVRMRLCARRPESFSVARGRVVPGQRT